MPSFAKLIWRGVEALQGLAGAVAELVRPSVVADKGATEGAQRSARRRRSRYGGFTSSRGVLNGEWVPVLSSWIDAARWEEETRTLWIRTLYQRREYSWCRGISRELARSFFRVRSAGKWIWRHALLDISGLLPQPNRQRHEQRKGDGRVESGGRGGVSEGALRSRSVALLPGASWGYAEVRHG